ncbi:MAG: hypothetical protein ACTHLN_04060 [Tepidisphaeraceae bacterium]
MGSSSQNEVEVSEETGVADVRRVRELIAARHHGDLREHIAETRRIVEPLIEQLGLKQGAPIRGDDRRQGTAG